MEVLETMAVLRLGDELHRGHDPASNIRPGCNVDLGMDQNGIEFEAREIRFEARTRREKCVALSAHGEHLVAQAMAHPEQGFIGADGFLNAVGKLLVAIDDEDLTNIRVFHGDAIDLIDWLPAGAFSRIDLLYPDPWPKRRQWKRRFIQDESLPRIARLLKSGGEFRFATDIPSYMTYALTRIMRSKDFIWTAEAADDWRKPWDGWTRTRYEAKAIREGRTPAYFIFRRR